MWELDCEESWVPKNWCFWTGMLEKTLESPWTARRSNQSILKKTLLNVHWKDWCWSWNSNTLATWCTELTHLKRPWCWERLMVRGAGDDRGWGSWMGSLTRWTWVWVNSGSCWWTGRPGVLQPMGSQKFRHGWATELNWICYRCEINKVFGISRVYHLTYHLLASDICCCPFIAHFLKISQEYYI